MLPLRVSACRQRLVTAVGPRAPPGAGPRRPFTQGGCTCVCWHTAQPTRPRTTARQSTPHNKTAAPAPRRARHPRRLAGRIYLAAAHPRGRNSAKKIWRSSSFCACMLPWQPSRAILVKHRGSNLESSSAPKHDETSRNKPQQATISCNRPQHAETCRNRRQQRLYPPRLPVCRRRRRARQTNTARCRIRIPPRPTSAQAEPAKFAGGPAAGSPGANRAGGPATGSPPPAPPRRGQRGPPPPPPPRDPHLRLGDEEGEGEG